MLYSFPIHYHSLFTAVLASIDRDIQSVTEGETANFTCPFSKGDNASDDFTVYWTVDGVEYDCVNREEDIRLDNIRCYTTETQSDLIIRNTSSYSPYRRYPVQCNLQQTIPEEFTEDPSFKNGILTRTAFLAIICESKWCVLFYTVWFVSYLNSSVMSLRLLPTVYQVVLDRSESVVCYCIVLIILEGFDVLVLDA